MDADLAYERKLIQLEQDRLRSFTDKSAFNAPALEALPNRIVLRNHAFPEALPSAALIYFSDLTFEEVAAGKYCSAMVKAAPKRSVALSTDQIALPYILMQIEVADKGEPGSQEVSLELQNCFDGLTEAQLSDALPLGSFLSIKSPYLTLSSRHQSQVLRIDHPSDIEVRPPELARDHEAMKQIGNQAFRQKRYNSALRAWQSIRSKNQDFQASLWLNIAAVLIELHRYEEAIHYCDQVLGISKFNAKARYRKAVAMYGLRDFTNPYLETFLRDESMRLTESSPQALRGLLDRLTLRLREARGQFTWRDWHRLHEFAKQGLRVDFANYNSPYIERREVSGAGIGLFARRSLRVGDLIMVAKAAALQLPSEARLTDVPIIDLVDETVHTTQSPNLLDALAQSAHISNTMCEQWSQLYAGEEYSRTPKTKLSSHQLRKMIQYNSFALEDSEVELPTLFQRQDLPPQEEGARGFWHMPSYFNHSCLNNCSRMFMGDIMIIKANRDIDKDEELTLGYVHRFQLFKERQEACQDFGFTCACELCMVEKEELDKFPSIVDERRVLQAQWRAKVEHLRDDLPKLVGETEAFLEQLRATYEKTQRTQYHFATIVPLDVLVLSNKALGQFPQAYAAAMDMAALGCGLFDDYTLGINLHIALIRQAMSDVSPPLGDRIAQYIAATMESLVAIAKGWRCRGLVAGLPGFIRGFKQVYDGDAIKRGEAIGFGIIRGFLMLEQDLQRGVLDFDLSMNETSKASE
ncbi:hypothetical protein BCR37DRAFT_163738 [Protomyces lactucae-debilis]|uniref:SET domain-containing protein n=1 Tax=Protomyces lactucae-debilis TaxID=2754530 RepID=A0A1Y2EXU8_PROLT|nr:uncharacterized protein BCR37DRAFT_163738 [Protomyces lactucae-debilis]ORY76317.1 hypothetical protein BCR37DRAFT_163738 [Protomyces lactucae-debilis]